MATTDPTIPPRPRINLAVFLSIIAILLSLLFGALTIGAQNRAQQAQDKADQTRAYVDEVTRQAINEASKASTGANGPNVETQPNANGQ